MATIEEAIANYTRAKDNPDSSVPHSAIFLSGILNISRGIAATILGFTEHQAKRVFVLVDFNCGEIGSLVEIEEKVFAPEKVLETETIHQFSRTSEEIESFKNYLQSDLTELQDFLSKHHLAKPSRLVTFQSGVVLPTTKICYGENSMLGKPIADQLQEWRRYLPENNWNPLKLLP